jgi:putative flippase GtrA
VRTVIDTARPTLQREPPRRWPRAARFARYTVGSVAATVVSAVVFALGYRWLGLGPRSTSVAAFACGAVVNFVVNRFWAWDRRRLPGLGRDLASYAVIALLTAGGAAGITTLAERYAVRVGASENYRAVLVEVAYFGAYALMFGVKFVLLDRLVFGRGRSSKQRRSR